MTLVTLVPALLRACCRGEGDPPDPDLARAVAAASPEEWSRAAAILASHRLLPLAGHALGEELLAQAPARFADAVRAAFRATFVRNFVAMRGLDDTLAALRGEGIEPVVLKGAALVNTLYPVLAARPMGDVDLLVEAGERERAAAALARLGWRRAAQEEDATNFVGADGLRVDLAHRFRLFEGRPRADWTEVVEPRFLSHRRLVTLEPNALLVHLVVHMNGHRRQIGHLLAWFVDVAFVLRESAPRLERARLLALLDGDEAWTWLVRTGRPARRARRAAPRRARARVPDCTPLTLDEVLRSRRVHAAAPTAARLLGRLLALPVRRRAAGRGETGARRRARARRRRRPRAARATRRRPLAARAAVANRAISSTGAPRRARRAAGGRRRGCSRPRASSRCAPA